MKKNKKWDIVLMSVFAVMAVVSAILIIVFANVMYTKGVTQHSIWGMVALCLAFVVSMIIFSALFTLYRFDKNQPKIKYEDGPNKEQSNEEKTENKEENANKNNK